MKYLSLGIGRTGADFEVREGQKSSFGRGLEIPERDKVNRNQ
jgi:hypothetical protein